MPPPPRSVLFLTGRDTSHPERGGTVTLFCAAHRGAPAEEVRGGVRVMRRGGHATVFLHAVLLHAAGRLGSHDLVVDVQNGLPFFARLWCRRPVVVLVHHVHREQWP